MKTDPSIIYMVPDHKQNVWQMRYQEGQIYYYGLEVIILLVFMIIRWKVDGNVSGFEYPFFDFVIKGYSGQDNVQMAAVTPLAVDTV